MNPPNSENENDPLRNYFRAIDYLENNIDFPPDQTDNLIERDICTTRKYLQLY